MHSCFSHTAQKLLHKDNMRNIYIQQSPLGIRHADKDRIHQESNIKKSGLVRGRIKLYEGL